MAGFRLTGVGDALAMTQNPSMKQLQNDAASYITTIGGTGNAITLTPTFADDRLHCRLAADVCCCGQQYWSGNGQRQLVGREVNHQFGRHGACC